MFVILISPAIAFIADYFLRKGKRGTQWAILLIALLVAPSILLVLTGYSFRNQLHSFIATTLFLTGAQLGLFTMIHVRLSVKVAASIVFILILGTFVFVSSFASEWAPRTIMHEARAKNYIALILAPLYSNPRVLRVKKTALSGIIEKNVYEQDLSDSVLKIDCNINFSDGSKKLVFNSCENKLGFRD